VPRDSSETLSNQFLSVDELSGTDYTLTETPVFDSFKADKTELGEMKLTSVPAYNGCDLIRRLQWFKPLTVPERRLVLHVEQADTEELKDLEISVEGDRAIFKVGEGETAHWHVPNDKKLWET